jgi:hypothetical protein
MTYILSLAADRMPLSFLICLIGFGIFRISAYFVYAIWIPVFVQRHGGRTAGFAAHLLLGSAWLRDYREAHAICRRAGLTPWFVRLFEVLEVVAILFFMAGICSALWAR